MTYHVDRLYAAVTALAGDGHIKQRLISAYQDHLDDIDADELPADAQSAFNKLRSRMYAVSPLNGEGPICASVRKMSAIEASECAETIVDVFRELIASATSLTSQAVDAADADTVPPFLVQSVS